MPTKRLRAGCLPALLTITVAAGASVVAGKPAVPGRPDDKTIVHVLNRIGFGPRPGDVDRVRAAGLEGYIEQQLQPSKIDDSAIEARLASFETLTKSSRAIAQGYVVPAMLARAKPQLADPAGQPAPATADSSAALAHARAD